MKVIHGKIVEATEDELYEFWLKHWSDFMGFDDYMRRMKSKGVKIIEDK